MTHLKLMTWLVAPSLLLFASSCAVPKFEATSVSTRRAIERGDAKEALAFHEAEAKEAEKRSNWEAATNSYIQAATAAGSAGQLQKAIVYATKALETAEKTRLPNLRVYAAVRVIIAYRDVRNFDRAKELIDSGFEAVKEIPPNTNARVNWESNLYGVLGGDLLRRREYERAIDAFSQSVYLQQQRLSWLRSQTAIEGARTLLIVRLIQLGDAYREAGKFEEALEQYRRVFSSIENWGLKYFAVWSVYEGMGALYLLEKNFSEALESFKKALALGQSQQRPDVIGSASQRIGDVLRQTGKTAEAMPYYQKAVQYMESTRSLLESQEYRQSYFEGGLDAYFKIIGVLLEMGRPEEAFNYSERARSRVFLDVLGSKVQLSRVKSGLLEEERALNERIASIKARLMGNEEGRTESAVLRKELAEAESAYNAFLSKVRKQDKEQASLMTVEPLTLKEVQELLDPGTTLIEYFVAQSSIYVWVVEKDRLQSVTVELPREKLSSLVKTLRESIFTLGEKEKLNEASTSLYKHLIHGVLPHVTGKELIIVPHDVLHYLPFHALVGPDARYLIEKYPIYYLSSASLLQFTKEKRKAKGDRVLALGNPDLGDAKMNLEFAELEAKEVQKLYPQSTVLLKKEATEEKSKSLSPQHDIVHFATHAELNEDDPLSSAVLLAKDAKEDGRLEVREIFGMDLKANLVVLSGCETGLGKLSTGDELVGLTRAFIYAGTPSVVASLWNVEDSSTAALMASFNKNLKTMTKVEALRQAQLELIRGQASSDLLARRGIGGIGKLGETPSAMHSAPSPVSVSTSHPYFWAPFILVGDGK